jgi:predicted RNase H-like nuclease
MTVPVLCEAPGESFALGLDWIDSKTGWAYCCLSINLASTLHLGCLPCTQVMMSPLVREATNIVVDAPIGLPEDEGRTCKYRPCDMGARRWLGPLKSSVFAPPIDIELQEWERRRRTGERQRQGHAFGLLPAISSAGRLRETNDSILESHPELVFSAIAGKPLPVEGKKTLLLGLLARATLLQKHGISLDLQTFRDLGKVPTDNFLDAIAMALVALAWKRAGSDLQVIRDHGGLIERLGDCASRSFLMALPRIELRRGEEPTMTLNELVELASNFRP